MSVPVFYRDFESPTLNISYPVSFIKKRLTRGLVEGFTINCMTSNLRSASGLTILLSLIIGFVGFTLLTACSKQDSNQPIKGRWYTGDQLKLGKQVFADNCAVCHGSNAESIPNWKKTQADGSYPPPPLNGSAHAWHHSMSILTRTINEGGAKIGGKMPGFKDKLSEAEKTAAIAFFQSYWDERVYGIWIDNGNLTK